MANPHPHGTTPVLFGATFDPARETELVSARDQLHTIEVKHIEPEFVRSILPVVQVFKDVSLHVQYLSLHDEPLTLNLCDQDIHDELKNINAPFYETVRLLEPRWISFHAGFTASRISVSGEDQHNTALSEVLPREEILARHTRALNAVRANLDRLGVSAPVLIENLDRQSTAYEVAPDFLDALMKQTGTELLLDLAHAVISARYLGEATTLEYVRRFLGSRLREVHVCAPTVGPGGNLMDVNQPFTSMPEVEALLRHLIEAHLHGTFINDSLLLTFECPRGLEGQLEAAEALIDKVR